MPLTPSSVSLGHGWSPRTGDVPTVAGLYDFFGRLMDTSDGRPRLVPPETGSGTEFEEAYSLPRCLYFYLGLVHRAHANGRMGLLCKTPVAPTTTPFDSGAWHGFLVAVLSPLLPGRTESDLRSVVRRTARRFLCHTSPAAICRRHARFIPLEFGGWREYLAGAPPKRDRVPPVFAECLDAVALTPSVDRRAWTWEVQAPELHAENVATVLLSESIMHTIAQTASKYGMSIPQLLKASFPSATVERIKPSSWPRGPLDLEREATRRFQHLAVSEAW